jgi:hypothetical protein
VSLSVVSLVAAYAAVTMLLLSLNLTSLWRWWIKAAAIIVTTVFFGVTYQGINGLMGWPTTQKVPYHFNLVSSRITEPDRLHRLPGFIYLWTEEIDNNNVPSGRPRGYQIPYSEMLARKVSDAQEKRNQGIEVMGRITDEQGDEDKKSKAGAQGGKMRDNQGQQAPATDTVPFQEDGSDVSFEDLPPVLLPPKEVE